MVLRELYLDTTYLMPFFYLDINVKGFTRSLYKEIIKSLEKVHISEISIIEAKAKSLKIGTKDFEEKFNEGLSVLYTDEKVVVHRYSPIDDKKFNELLSHRLGFFDTVILAQSFSIGTLLTEDSKLLKLKDTGVRTINWEALLRETGKEYV